MIRTGEFHIAVIDLHMPGMNGIELCLAANGAERGWPVDRARDASTVTAGRLTRLLLHTTGAGSVESDKLEVRA